MRWAGEIFVVVMRASDGIYGLVDICAEMRCDHCIRMVLSWVRPEGIIKGRSGGERTS